MKQHDPRQLGARCDDCPLGPRGCLNQTWEPVPSEVHEGASIAAVLEAPKTEDVDAGRPLAGLDGGEWALALRSVRLQRTDIDLFHAIQCSPPQNWKRMEASIRRHRKVLEKGYRAYEGMNATTAKAKAAQDIPHPLECCAPRLQRELAQYDYIFTLGATAGQTLLRTERTIGSLEGDMVETTAQKLFWDAFDWTQATSNWPVKVLPTYDPGHVKHMPKLRPQFHASLGKGLRFFNDMLNWREPELLTQPTPEELEEWLAVPSPFWVYDVETDGINVMDINVDCLAIATPDLLADGTPAMPWEKPAHLARSVGIHLDNDLIRWADGPEKVRTLAEWESWKLREILIGFFTDPSKLKVGHNAGYFDRMCIEHVFGVTPAPVKDTLFDARSKFPDLPKGLKPTGRRETDVHQWETTDDGEASATSRRKVKSRLLYCQYDTVVNARIEPPLRLGADNNGTDRLLPEWSRPSSLAPGERWTLRTLDHQRQDMCVQMHQNGIYIDQKLVGELTTTFEKVADNLYNDLQELAQYVGVRKLDKASASDDVRFNPGSYDQIRDLLYEDWDLGCPYGMDTKDFYTDTGLPGTGDEVLRAHMANKDLDAKRRIFLLKLRQYRRVRNKILGGTLRKMIPLSEDGLLHPDGRVRSTWNSHSVSVARLASSRPNMQNRSSRKDIGGVRRIYCAAPGNVLVGCDLDQAHLRVTANYWKIDRLLECFLAEKDPHCWLAHDLFGPDFENAPGWKTGFSLRQDSKPSKKSKAGLMRELAKTYRYASIYWASPETKHSVIMSTEQTKLTEEGKLVTDLPYLRFELQQVQFFDQVWHDAEPDWKRAWADMMALFDKQGFMEDPLFRRRSGTLNNGKKNEVVNFPIIACEVAAMAIAEQRVLESFPFQKWGPGTGLVAQVHDSMIVEVPAALGEWARDEMTRCMTIHVPGWEVPFTCEADIGQTWAEV